MFPLPSRERARVRAPSEVITLTSVLSHRERRSNNGNYSSITDTSLFAFATHHRESLALRLRHDGARTVTVERAAASRRKLLNVTPVGGAGETEAHDFHPLAFHRIVIENESIDVRHQITFPRAHRQAFIFLKEFPLWTETVAELKGIAEDELIIVKKVDHMWRVGARKKAHKLVRDIEMLVRNVKRECEDRAGAPFEDLF